jgi:hypothetical protein
MCDDAFMVNALAIHVLRLITAGPVVSGMMVCWKVKEVVVLTVA